MGISGLAPAKSELSTLAPRVVVVFASIFVECLPHAEIPPPPENLLSVSPPTASM